jgi:primosomal protein N' (replication factor Y)
VAPPPPGRGGEAGGAEVWIDAGREERLADHLMHGGGAALVIAPDVATAGRWAERLDAARLDSGSPGPERRRAWFAAARGRARIVVGTRSALLAPLPPPATLVVLDEHDGAHKPPGAPRIHARDMLRRRAEVEGNRLILLSPTPAVETWWRVRRGELTLVGEDRAAWPEIAVADARGVLARHPLTLPLTRAIDRMTRAGRRVILVVARTLGVLGCEECGAVLRCGDCGMALGWAPTTRTLACRVCARARALPQACPGCGGHRLSPFGWGADRVEAAVRRRFPRLAVSRKDPGAQVLIGTAGLLRGLPAGSAGAVGFVSLDTLLSLPDFRASERAFQMLWAAAVAAGRDGLVVVQTRHQDHYAIQAARARERATFYDEEIRLRSELGYPPFRRLCLVTARGRGADGGRALATECLERMAGLPDLVAYPPLPIGAAGARRWWRLVVKGPHDLPARIGPALLPFLERRRRGGGVVEVDMDPVTLA